jgi:predicted nucleic acid-binding protein
MPAPDFAGPDFLDTNILVYAYDPSDRRKQAIAQNLVRQAVAGDIVVSAQVLAEFAATLLHKLSPPAKPRDVIAALDVLSPIRTIVPDGDLVRRAVELRDRYGLHFYDCMIVAAAERGSCARIWSEDMSAGQSYFGVVVHNPFDE